MNTSTTIIKILPALLASQKKIEAVTKSADNPFFHSKYADLNSLIDACKDILNANDIVIIQPINADMVETILLHTSGEWVSSTTKIVAKTDTNPQDQGSAITYARRYGLQSMLFMSAEDDDGEKATSHTSPKPLETKITGEVVREPIDDRMEFKDSKCKDCGGDIVISKTTGSPYCKNKCWLQENLHFRNKK
jgi:hypothetical protein